MENGLTLRDFLHLIRRRKWIVLQTVVLVTLVVTALSVSQPKLYQSSARVLLSFQNLANQLSGVSGGSSVVQQPDRVARTQAGVARTSAVAQRVLDKVPRRGPHRGRSTGRVERLAESERRRAHLHRHEPQPDSRPAPRQRIRGGVRGVSPRARCGSDSARPCKREGVAEPGFRRPAPRTQSFARSSSSATRRSRPWKRCRRRTLR